MAEDIHEWLQFVVIEQFTLSCILEPSVNITGTSAYFCRVYENWFAVFDFRELRILRFIFMFGFRCCVLFHLLSLPPSAAWKKAEEAWYIYGVHNRETRKETLRKLPQIFISFNKTAFNSYCHYILEKCILMFSCINIEENWLMEYNKEVVWILLDVSCFLSHQGLALRDQAVMKMVILFR